MKGRPYKIHFLVFKFDHPHSATEHHQLSRGKIKALLPRDYLSLSQVLNSYRSFAKGRRRSYPFRDDLVLLDDLPADGIFLTLRAVKYRRGLRESYFIPKIGSLATPCFISSLAVRYTPLKCDNPQTN
jgi:hypothetical protein